MKNHIIISLLILSVGFSQKEYDGNDLIKMDNGLWTYWYENGQKKYEWNYKK